MLNRSIVKLFGAVLLLLLAAWLFWRDLLAVPPGLEMDELIEAQISTQVLRGDWRFFYTAGQGREGLYYYWLAGWLELLGKSVFTIRIASTTLSLLGLAGGYALIQRLFGPATALVNLAASATSFWMLFAARSGLRSTALPLMAALAGYFFWRALPFSAGDYPKQTRSHRSSLLFFAGAGLCLGLSVYTHTAVRVLPGVFFVFALYLLLFHRRSRSTEPPALPPALHPQRGASDPQRGASGSRRSLSGRWRGLLGGGFVTLLTITPLVYYLRAHPEADRFDFMDFDRPLTALAQGDLEPVLKSSLATLGGFTFRGDPLIFDNVPGRPIFDALGSALFLIGVTIAVMRFRRPAYAFVLLWLLASLIPGMLSEPAPNFYRIVGAQVIVFIFPALTIVEAGRYMRKRWSARPPTLLLVGGLALALTVHLAASWQAYFDTWPNVEGVRFFWQSGLVQAARYLDRAPDSSPVALCTVLTYEHDPWWRPAWQSMPYLLRRTDLDIRYYDCRSTLVFPSDPSQRSEQVPVRYFFPETPDPLALIPGEFQQEWMTTSETLPSGQSALLQLDDYPQPPPLDSNAIWLAPEAGGEPATLPVRFGDSLVLRGYQRTPAHPRPGEPLRLITSWEVIKTPAPRLVLFTHLLTDPHTLVAQQDSLALTSHSLRPGDRFLVLHDQIITPADPAVEQYLLPIGLYDSDTLVRLLIYDGDQARGDRLFLEPVEVGTQ